MSRVTTSPVIKATLPIGAIIVPTFSTAPPIKAAKPPFDILSAPLFKRSLSTCS